MTSAWAPRLTLLITSPRVAPGLLSAPAWRALTRADTVLAATADDPLVEVLRAEDLTVDLVDDLNPADLARDLLGRARAGGAVVWVMSPDGDPGLTEAIASELSAGSAGGAGDGGVGTTSVPEVEAVVGSYDVPGARLLDVVAAMDRLRSPGGCPWDAEQTHASLAPYLVEETYETLEAIDSGRGCELAAELGDVLLQVVFHARIAADAASQDERFDIDTVAGLLVDKLVRRHPHVFADGSADSPEQVERQWERIKAVERGGADGAAAHRSDLAADLPAGLPVELAAAKVRARARRTGRQIPAQQERDLDEALSGLAAARDSASAAMRAAAAAAGGADGRGSAQREEGMSPSGADGADG